MNEIPLEYWGVLTRVGSEVKIVNKQNSAAVFARFEDLGLNNFDFFSTGFFESGFTTP
jgi:3-deoxy-D-manno-octulosonate 8-phosphate phosphatase KdsC-like HAD superfamily phosphatase